jgi:hypothetical protein
MVVRANVSRDDQASRYVDMGAVRLPAHPARIDYEIALGRLAVEGLDDDAATENDAHGPDVV